MYNNKGAYYILLFFKLVKNSYWQIGKTLDSGKFKNVK